MRYLILVAVLISMISCQKDKAAFLNGQWDWKCCNESYNGTIVIDQKMDTISGLFITAPQNDTTKILGYIKGDTLYFKRLHQNYFLAKQSKDSFTGFLESGNVKQDMILTRK